MPKQLIISEAENVELAIKEGLNRLGKDREQVDIEILEEEQPGLFGENANKARVKMTTQGVNLEEVVRNLLTDMLDILGLEKYELEIDIDEQYYRINIHTPEQFQEIIGPEGETLNALQSLVAEQIHQFGAENIEVIVDVGEYRSQRKEELKKHVTLIANQALEKEQEIELEPMIKTERQIIHSVIDTIEGVKSHSIGEGKNRRVVVLPRGKS
ncbi:MAG: RNA-binding cell elongation regulator Jag/EloR [bacterium]